jgi:hypothetical protein
MGSAFVYVGADVAKNSIELFRPTLRLPTFMPIAEISYRTAKDTSHRLNTH